MGTTPVKQSSPDSVPVELVKGLGPLDSTTIVMGSMIGSGIFIVAADVARQVQSPGLFLLAWVFSGLMTVTAAVTYGELAAMMPKAGGQYIYLREAFMVASFAVAACAVAALAASRAVSRFRPAEVLRYE